MIYHPIFIKFHAWFTFIKLSPKFEYKFCLMKDYMKTACTCGHSNLVIYNPMSSKLHIWTNFIKLFPKINFGYCPMNYKQDGCTNGHRLSVCTCGHSNLVIYHPMSSKLHIWTNFIKLFPKINFGYCPMNDKQDGCTNGHRLSVYTCGHSNLVIYNPMSSKLHTRDDPKVLIFTL